VTITENTRNTITGFEILLAEDFSLRKEFEQKLQAEVNDLSLIDDDEDAKEAIRLIKEFFTKCNEHAKKLNKLQLKESVYEDALRNTQAQPQREFILTKLEEISNEKKIF
jgi:alcohol dehydrogenase YqhD (iron-dependent ADH family)